MKINVNLGQLKTVGNYGLRLGKTIVIEGTKAVAINTAKTFFTAGYEGGIDGMKSVGWNDLLSDKEARTYKKLKKKEKVSSLKAENAMLKKKLAKMEEEEIVIVAVEDTEVTE